MIYIEEKSWNKLLNYAKSAVEEFSAEIGGMALLEQDDEGDWWITDPVILKQEVTGANCELDAEELSKYYTTHAMKDRDIRFVWWHSHAEMKAFWSGTDISTMKSDQSSDWSIALVINVKGEYKLRINWISPVKHVEDVELQIVGKSIPKYITKEVVELCSKPITNIAKYNKNTKWERDKNTEWKQGKNINQENMFNREVERHNPYEIDYNVYDEGDKYFMWDGWWNTGYERREGINAHDIRKLAIIIQDFFITLDYNEFSTAINDLNKLMNQFNVKLKIPANQSEAIDWFGDCCDETFNIENYIHVKS